jgi:hypothetical protein
MPLEIGLNHVKDYFHLLFYVLFVVLNSFKWYFIN